MAGNVLVDSSFYIDRLRAELDPFAEFGEAHGHVRFFHVRNREERKSCVAWKHKNAHRRMSELMDCMFYVPTPNPVWERAERLAWELDRRGRVVQVTDLVIAVCALEADAARRCSPSIRTLGVSPGLRTRCAGWVEARLPQLICARNTATAASISASVL